MRGDDRAMKMTWRSWKARRGGGAGVDEGGEEGIDPVSRLYIYGDERRLVI